jgi:PAS domain S-box-containing protein
MIMDKVEIIPFDWILTDEYGFIKSWELSPSFFKKDLVDVKISDLFDTWDEKDKDIVLVSYHEKNYLLICKDLEQKQELLRMNILVQAESIHEAYSKVKDLDNSIRELDAIIESSFDGIYITDVNGVTLKTNSAIERITGIPKHYYVGKNTNDLVKRGILKESVTMKVRKEKKTITVVQRNFNGKETLLTGNPVFNEKGEVEKIVTNIRDLSELNGLNEELKRAQQLNEQYKQELQKLKANTIIDSETIIKSKRMREIYEMTDRIAQFDTTILVLGETGVGKDVLVRHLYRNSPRSREGQLIKVNCGAIPKDLLESELFGYEGGAFSGAARAGKAGMFELAHKGFLFLDEIGELPLDLQVKLLRAIQEKEIMRVGGTKVIKVDIQLIAATNKDLKLMVERGEFREDLYYRLNVVPITIPPLRERQDDILPLIHHFLEVYNHKYKVIKELDRDLKSFFYYYEWPGNVRELSNLVERLILTVSTPLLTIEDLPGEYKKNPLMNQFTEQEELSLKEVVEKTEKTLLERVLQECKTTYEIAERLKTSQPTIVRKLKKYQLSLKN